MKRIILVAVATIALVGGGISVFANGGKGGPPRQHPAFGNQFAGRGHGIQGKHHHRRKLMGKKLGLTDEQKAKVKDLAKGLRDKDKGNREQFRKDMRAGMQNILNAEQKVKVKKFKQQRHEKKGDEKQKEAPAQPQRQQNFGPKRG